MSRATGIPFHGNEYKLKSLHGTYSEYFSILFFNLIWKRTKLFRVLLGNDVTEQVYAKKED
jgi:hypothetical protein